MSPLFAPITIAGRTIRNRIVMPPMVCFGWGDDEGLVSEKHVAHYEALARGGTGLVILEAHAVSKAGRLARSQLGLWSDTHVAGLRRLADVCHRHGAVVLVQIHHAGSRTPLDVCEPSLAPSDVYEEKRRARAMSTEEIGAVQQQYVDAALRAQHAGIDGVELHGAHGYLLCQFMSPVANQRTDSYGGSREKRMRFGAEVVRKVRAAVGADFILGYRMGGNEPSLDDGAAIAQELERSGVDLLHVSSGLGGGAAVEAPGGFGHNWFVYMASEVRRHVRVPVIAVNCIRTPQQAEDILSRDLADMTAIGRAMLVDPEWAAKAQDGREILACLNCNPCRWFVDGERCVALRKQQATNSSSLIVRRSRSSSLTDSSRMGGNGWPDLDPGGRR